MFDLKDIVCYLIVAFPVVCWIGDYLNSKGWRI